MPRKFLSYFGTAALILTAACGSEETAKEQAAICAVAPGYAAEVSAQEIGSVSATMVDAAGQPASDLLVQVCGLDLCISANTQANGKAIVAVNKPLKKPAFKYGTGVEYAKLAFLLNKTGDLELGTITATKLPDTGATIARGQAATSNDVTLSLASNAEIKFDTLVYPDSDTQQFRVTRIEHPETLLAVDANLGLELVFAVAPIETEFCPPAKLSVLNSLNWQAGTAVEFYVHGVDVDEQWAPYAGWTKLCDGVVNADGSRIDTPENALPVLSSFGIRRKP